MPHYSIEYSIIHCLTSLLDRFYYLSELVDLYFYIGKVSFQCWVVDELYTIHGSDAALGIGISVLILFYWQADYYQP